MSEYGDFWASNNIGVFGKMDFSPQPYFGSSLGSYYSPPQSNFSAPQHSFTLPPTSYSPPPPSPTVTSAPPVNLPTKMSTEMTFSVGVMDYYGGVATALSSLTASAAGPVASTASWIEHQFASHVINMPNIVGGIVTLGQVAYAAFGKDRPDLRDIVVAAGSTIIGTASTEAVGFSLATRAAAAVAVASTPLSPVAAAFILGGVAMGSSLTGALATGAAYDHYTMDQLESLADRVMQKVYDTVGVSNDH